MSQISQQSMLQKVRTWSEEQCKDDYESAMPAILHEIMSASSMETVELCSMVVEKFLCHAMVDDLGQKIFNTVSLELGHIFNEALENLPGGHQHSTTPNQSSTIEVLKYLIEVLKCYNGFIHRLASLVKSAVDIELLYISEFSNNTIDILRKSYLHCKNSEKDYGKLFRHVSGLLGILFQKTYGMQKNFGFIIANIKQTPELILSDETKTSVKKLCQGLLSVCETTCTVDNTLLTSTWTTMVKFMKEFKDVVQDNIYPNPYLVLLCDNIVQCVRYSIQLHDQSHHLLSSGDEATKKALNQSLKFSKLLMSVLYEVMRIFDRMFDEDLACHILMFFHDFNELFEVKDSTNCSEVDKVKFRRKMIEQLPHYGRVIGLILNNSRFLDYFTTFSYDSQKIPDYGWLHVWLSIIKELLKSSDTMTQWVVKISDDTVAPVLLVQLIVECVGSTRNVSQSHFNEGASLYETNLVMVCALLSQLPPDAFTKTEESIFDVMLSATRTKNVFAADLFTFLAQSSPLLSKRFKSVVCTILSTMNHVEKLTSSLLTLISIANRLGISSKEVAQVLSCQSNILPDWFCLIQNNNFDHSDISFVKVNGNISNISQRDEISVCNMHDLSNLMIQLKMAANSPSIAKKDMPLLKSTFSSVINIILHFEKPNKELLSSVIFSGFLSHFIASLKNFMSSLHKTEKNKVLKYLQTLLIDDVALPIKLEIIDLLSCCKNATSESLETISAMFKTLFFDKNSMVRHISITTFITLTLSPSQNTLLEMCASDAAVSEIIEGYLSFDCEPATLCVQPLPKPDNVCDLQMETLLSSWKDRHCKQSESIFPKNKSRLERDRFCQCVSQIKVDMQQLNQVISQNEITKENISAEDLQNLSVIKTELDKLLNQFKL